MTTLSITVYPHVADVAREVLSEMEALAAFINEAGTDVPLSDEDLDQLREHITPAGLAWLRSLAAVLPAAKPLLVADGEPGLGRC
jgi:hypothetical protein